jgi:hypothetical protein
MTTIHYERAGGFAGMRLTAIFELETLPAEDALALETLLTAADFFALPEVSPAPPIPDEFTYTVTDEETERQRTLRTSDTAAPETLRALLDELLRQARAQRHSG